MPSGQLVTPVAEGAARHTDLFLMWGFDGALFQMASRGSAPGVGTISSNWGSSGEGTTYLGNFDGSWIMRQRGGATEVFNRRIPIQKVRPVWRRWYPEPQLHVVYGFIAWPTNNNTAVQDNGLFLSYSNVPQILGGAGQGFQIHNNGGTITFSQRGPVGLVSTALSTVAAPLNPQVKNLVRIELRQPTNANDGSLSVFFNDDSAPRVVVSTSDANWPDVTAAAQSGLMLGIGQVSAVEYFYCRDLGYYAGPDTTQGM